jgi:hypothetical protein
MNFYAQPGVHANHSKKKSTISTNSPALSRKKKQRPKHPCKKYYASVARTPSARQTKEVDVPDAMPWVEKSAMSTQAKDATTLQLLRGQIQGAFE